MNEESYMSGTGKKQKLFTDYELHEGWIEICKNEKKSLIKSIQSSIQNGYAKDLDRAQKILKVELDNQSDSEGELENLNQEMIGGIDSSQIYKKSNLSSSLYQSEYYRSKIKANSFSNKNSNNGSLQRPRKLEMLFEDQIMNLKIYSSVICIASSLREEIWFYQKRVFDKKEVRCLQSKINLKFPFKEMLGDKPKEKISIREGHHEEFDRIYKEMCNPWYQRNKNSNVSGQSPFNKNNVPPKQYLEYDYEIAKSLTKLDPSEFNPKSVPLAGRVTEIGQRILDLGSKKAQYITSIKLGNPDLVIEEEDFVGRSKKVANIVKRNLLEKSPTNSQSEKLELQPSSFSKYSSVRNSPVRFQLPNIDLNSQLKKRDINFQNLKNRLNMTQLPTPQTSSKEDLLLIRNQNNQIIDQSQINSKMSTDRLSIIKEIRRQKNQVRLKERTQFISKSQLSMSQLYSNEGSKKQDQEISSFILQRDNTIKDQSFYQKPKNLNQTQALLLLNNQNQRDISRSPSPNKVIEKYKRRKFLEELVTRSSNLSSKRGSVIAKKINQVE